MRGRLIKEQDRAGQQESASDGYALLLTSGESQALLPDLCVQPFRQRCQEVRKPELDEKGGKTRIITPVLQGEILSKRKVEELRFLRDKSESMGECFVIATVLFSIP